VKGCIAKRTEPSQLACSRCANFVGDDPDVYYCALDCTEFPGLCEAYELKNVEILERLGEAYELKTVELLERLSEVPT
jgi:hypothetical protein